MRYRTLGKTGFEISEIGYGSWGTGGDWWKDARDEDSLASMNVACDLGVNYIDTAANYGMGRAEKLVGQVARGRSERIYVSTKVYPKNFNFVPSPGDSFAEAYPARLADRVYGEQPAQPGYGVRPTCRTSTSGWTSGRSTTSGRLRSTS